MEKKINNNNIYENIKIIKIIIRKCKYFTIFKKRWN